MNINFFANLFRLYRALTRGSHSLLVTTQKRSKDFLVTTITESFYLAMYFTFVAFLMGLSASLKWRYKDQFVSGFIRNNLPAMGNPSNQITWETFEHIGSKELSLHPLGFDSYPFNETTLASQASQGQGHALLAMQDPKGVPLDGFDVSLNGFDGLASQRMHALLAMQPYEVRPTRGQGDGPFDRAWNDRRTSLKPLKALESLSSREGLSLLVESPLVERIDVYNDSFVIKPKTPLEKLRSQKYIGFYIASPDRHQKATFGTSLANTDVSQLPLESRAELSDQLGPLSALTSSEWLYVPARGFVEFPKVGSLSTPWPKITSPLPQSRRPSTPLLVRTNAQHTPGAADAARVGWETPFSEPLVHPLVSAPAFSDPTDLPETFRMGSYPLITKRTLSETRDDESRLVTATGHLTSLSKGVIDAWVSSERWGRISRWSPLRRWVYQFCAYLDEIPYKLGSTTLSPDNFAVIESTTAVVGPLNMEKHSSQLGGAKLENKLCEPLRGESIRPEELDDTFPKLEVLRSRLQPGPLWGSNSSPSQHPLPVPYEAPEAQTTATSFQVGNAKPSRTWMREVERSPGDGNSLIGVKVMDAFIGAHPLRSIGAASLEFEGATPNKMLLSTCSQAEVGPSYAASPVSEAAPQRLENLSMKRQAFVKEAVALLISSDIVLWRNSQSWDSLPQLLTELNSAEVVASIDEGAKALEEGWEQLLGLLNNSVSRALSPIRPVPTRLMSGYNYPDSTRTKLTRDLFHWGVRHRFNLGEAASTLLLGEREVPLPASPSLPLPHSGALVPSNAKRWVDRQMLSIPLAEVDYLPVSLSGLDSLRDRLTGLEIEALEGELADIPMLEPTYQGPAVARDKATNDLVGKGREELTTWIVKAIQGYVGGAKSGALADLETALSSHQGNRLGKKEVLRSEPLVHEKLLAGVRARTGLDVEVSRDKTEEASNDVDPASHFVQPMKSNKMAPERFLTGRGPKLKDASQVLALESGDEPPLYPLEIVLTKAAPLFEEEEEVLSLEPDEWRNIFKEVVVQAIENKGSLDKIEILLPSIAVAHKSLENEIGTGNQLNLTETGFRRPCISTDARIACNATVRSQANEGATGLSRTKPGQPDGRLQKGHLGDRHDKYWGQEQRLFGKVDELTRVLTLQEYANLGILVAQSKRFVGECGYWPVNDLSAAEVPLASTPRLLCHYLPLSQVAIPESSAKRPISAGSYQKRITSFTPSHPFNDQLRSRSTPGRAVSPFSTVQRKQQMFSQLWEPVTANSWMMFYKLCFAFWIQEMGKDFYQRYGKEIILYALNLLVALGFDAQGMIEDLGLEESPMRVITNGARRFGDIAGIDSILPELGEIVWFLRSSGRGGQVPKGILLVGPPGTGKTFVVQAIAGEARVPVIVQSASSLRDSGQKQSGSQKLRDLFDRARQLSPCILFMDEIDTLGVSRPHVIGNTMGADELLESIEGGSSQKEDATNLAGAGRGLGERNDAIPELDPYLSFPPSPRASRESMLDEGEDDRPREEAPIFREGEGDPQDSPGLDPSVIELIESHNEDHRSRQERLALLMQFLMEMDGLRALHGVVVIGATNRPAVLDPAFTRPGRFEKILCLQLPGKQKRIDILKLYTTNLGLTDAIPPVDVNRFEGGTWEYLANRTAGWSAAHLAAAMNQSAIRAIIQETAHTIETVEHGINAIARRSFQASSNPSRQVLAEEGGTVANPLDTPFMTLFPQLPNLAEGGGPWWANLFVKLPQVRTIAHAHGAGPAGHRASQASQISQGLTGSETLTQGHSAARFGVSLNETSSIARWAYYQAGKAVLHTTLPLHPPAAFLTLRPQPFSKSSSDLAKLVGSTAQQGGREPHRRIVLETRLVGLYAGKAAEMLAFSAYSRTGRKSMSQVFATPFESPTSDNKQKEDTWTSQSDLGVEELTFAGIVANSMITSWYLYSKRVALQGLNLSTIARNVEEIDDQVLLDLLRHLEEDLEHQVERATRHPQRFQQWASPSWWQTQVMAEASLVEPGYSEWYRIYIPDPEETERNIDWVPPEDHYHAASANRLRNVSRKMRKSGSKSAPSRVLIGTNRTIRRRSMGSLSAITWNDLYLINRDYIYHGLINSCFQKAFVLLDQQRELMDFVSDYLIRYDLLRQYEIEHVCSNFGLEGHSSSETALGQGPFNEAPNRSRKGPWAGAPVSARPREVSTDSMGTTQSRAEGLGRRKGNEVFYPLPQDYSGSSKGGDLTKLAPNAARSTPLRESSVQALQGTGPQDDSSSPADSELNPLLEPLRGNASPPHSPYLVEHGWGFRSRRRISRFIDFDFVKPCYLNRLG